MLTYNNLYTNTKIEFNLLIYVKYLPTYIRYIIILTYDLYLWSVLGIFMVIYTNKIIINSCSDH